jgi:anaerobic selenocysteine-containing dehydrogenase
VVDPTHSAGVVAGPGGQYPKGYRSGTPFQTGQNWPLSWELRAFESKQRPGYVPHVEGEPVGAAEPSASSPPQQPDGRFVLYTQRMIYDEGAMISRTAALRAIQAKPFVEINDEDAKELGIADGDEVRVEGAGSSLTVQARVNGIAKGSVFLPYDQEGLKVSTLISGVNPTVSVSKP